MGYGNTGFGVFKRGFTFRNIFVQESTYSKKIIGLKVHRCQKLVIVLENKVIRKLMLSKIVHDTKCASKLILFNEKKLKKDLDDS